MYRISTSIQKLEINQFSLDPLLTLINSLNLLDQLHILIQPISIHNHKHPQNSPQPHPNPTHRSLNLPLNLLPLNALHP